ncbi:MAG: cysteine-rich repeat protein, partial [Hyphomicrobiaceae bacterium]
MKRLGLSNGSSMAAFAAALLLLVLLILPILASNASAQLGAVIAEQKISSTAGGFGGSLAAGAEFGTGVGNVGDLSGDSINDLAIGAPGLATRAGQVFLARLGSGGTVTSESVLDMNNALLSDGDGFGTAVQTYRPFVAGSGMIVVVGAPGDDTGGADTGAAYILRLDGTLAGVSLTTLASASTDFSFALTAGDRLGTSITTAGDIDNNGFDDVVIGIPGLDNGVGGLGYLLLDAVGRVLSSSIISNGGGFQPLGAALSAGDLFGSAMVGLGELGDGSNEEIAVGAPGSAGGGAVHILQGRADGPPFTGSGEVIIEGSNSTFVGAGGSVSSGDLFGSALAVVDIDGNGQLELLIGAPGADGKGAVWVVSINNAGDVLSAVKIGEGSGGFQGTLSAGGKFGSDITVLGDINGDGLPEIAIGNPGDSDGTAGATWIVSLGRCGDGNIDAEEQCDDGNLLDGDCCSRNCQLEGNGTVCTDDANECTDDVCFGATCTHTNNTVFCDDGRLCTEDDQCSGGACLGSDVDCSGSDDQCNTGVCNPGTGVCEAAPIGDGTGCDDGDLCTDTDVCTAGVCAGAAVDCSGSA